MTDGLLRLRRAEFEARLPVSLGIVLAVCALSYGILPPAAPNVVAIGTAFSASATTSAAVGFLAVAFLLAAATVLRMWAGSALGSDRVMASRVQTDALVVRGPYRLVRNPIYLADLLAMTAFALALPPAGVLLPVLLALHYDQVMRHEEAALAATAREAYAAYAASVGRLLPFGAERSEWAAAFREFRLTRDGIRHDAQYALFVPGFVLAAATGRVEFAYAVGAAAVVDWTVVHVRKRVRRTPAPRAVFREVLYAQCWEDPATDRAALAIRPGETVLCVTSGGCNALAFLLDDPARVIAVDMNPAQNRLLDLKRSALERLDHDELLEFAGARPSRRRARLYARVRPALSEESRAFWDARPRDVAAGLLRAGRFERFLDRVRASIRRTLGLAAIDGLWARPEPAARRAWFARRFDGLAWRFLTRVLLGRRVLGLFFDPAMFAWVDRDASVGAHFERRARRALTELPLRANPFLSWILRGRFDGDEGLPTWLRPEHHDVLRERTGRIETVTASCVECLRSLPDATVSKFDFSNVFEWVSPADHEAALAEAVRVARDGAVVVYRNLIVPRERPSSLAARLEPDRPLADALADRDLSFLYARYVVERVRKP